MACPSLSVRLIRTHLVQTATGVSFAISPDPLRRNLGTAETLAQYVNNPTYYIQNPGVFGTFNPQCVNFTTSDGSTCTYTPAGDGSFTQNVQRMALYAEDSWRVTPKLTVNYGLRWQSTWGLFLASGGRSEADNAAYITMQALQIPVVPSLPQDDHHQFAPRLGFAWTPGNSGNTVVRAGFGMFYDDLAQNGWATAFQGVNNTNYTTGPCALTGGPGTYALSGSGCLQGGAGATGNLVGSPYKTPYAIHITGGVQHAFNSQWLASADYVYEDGVHGYRAFPYTSGTNLFTPLIPKSDPDYATDQANVVPNVNVFESDNRSKYNALMLHLAGNTNRFNLVANYTLSRANTWGCLLGELFDYVDGVCQQANGQLNAFGPGDYGPSGENVTSRFMLAFTVHIPGGFEVSSINQFESARPITITNADNTGRIYVNGVYTSLDEFRGTPYLQTDLRVARPFKINERWQVYPFIEFFNLFNRNNPGANYAVNVVQLPVPASQMQPNSQGITNVTSVCTNPSCTTTAPITSLNQLEIPEGALGDFFGPGTTVGIPFAAQLGVRVTF